MIDMLTNLIVEITSQSICIWNHQIVHLKPTRFCISKAGEIFFFKSVLVLTESRLVVAGGWGAARMGVADNGTGFLFGVMFWN